jgi:hypothetical protein
MLLLQAHLVMTADTAATCHMLCCCELPVGQNLVSACVVQVLCQTTACILFCLSTRMKMQAVV